MASSEKNKSSVRPEEEEQGQKPIPYYSRIHHTTREKQSTDRKNIVEEKRNSMLGFSLCPEYSVKQLQKISLILKAKHGRAYLKSSLLRSTISFPVRQQLILKRVFNKEVIA